MVSTLILMSSATLPELETFCLEANGILETIFHVTAENYSVCTSVSLGEGGDVERLLKIMEISKIYFVENRKKKIMFPAKIDENC